LSLTMRQCGIVFRRLVIWRRVWRNRTTLTYFVCFRGLLLPKRAENTRLSGFDASITDVLTRSLWTPNLLRVTPITRGATAANIFGHGV
jgi:hypothetical protein